MSFDVVIRKMLEVVRALPFTADDLHHTRNAHGTFADTLYDLADKRKAAKPKTEKVGSQELLFCSLFGMFPAFAPESMKSAAKAGKSISHVRRLLLSS